MKNRKIILNQIRTPDGTVLRSMHVHDYVAHIDRNGKEYMVDGGNEYLRRNVYGDAPYEELTIYDDSTFDVIRTSLYRGGRGKDGKQPLKFVLLCNMSNEWLKSCIIYNKQLGIEDSFTSSMYKKELEYRKENNIIINENI